MRRRIGASTTAGYTQIMNGCHRFARRHRVAGLVCLLGLGATAARADDVKVWSEPVTGSDVPFSIAEATIDAPAALVWSVVSNCNDFKTTMPSIAASKELSRKGSGDSEVVECQVTADLPFPLPDLTSVTRARHAVQPDKRYVRSWQYLRGDYEFNEGSWTVVAVDEAHTRATYRLRAKPKMPVPDSLLGSFQQGTMPKIMLKLREAVATRKKTWKPAPAQEAAADTAPPTPAASPG